MAVKSRSKKKGKPEAPRIVRFVLLGAAILGGLAAAATNADKLVALWEKRFGEPPLGALRPARNAPRDLIWSSPDVSLELVQSSLESQEGVRLYDLYMKNNLDRDVLLSEVRYGPGAVHMSAGTAGVSGAAQPSAEYSVTATERHGSLALSPPFSLKAGSSGAFRLRMQSKSPNGSIAFEVYAADGIRVAAVNEMLGQ